MRFIVLIQQKGERSMQRNAGIVSNLSSRTFGKAKTFVAFVAFSAQCILEMMQKKVQKS